MMVVPFSNISMVPAAGIPTGDVLPCWAKAITPHPWPQVSDEGRCLGKRWWEEKNMIYIYIYIYIYSMNIHIYIYIEREYEYTYIQYAYLYI